MFTNFGRGIPSVYREKITVLFEYSYVQQYSMHEDKYVLHNYEYLWHI